MLQLTNVMGTYSIKDLEKLSGVKAHTIRIWESRYSLIEPKRTETNIRIYDDTQLKKLLNVSLLISNGHKISKISKIEVAQLNQMIADIYKKANESLITQSLEIQLNALIVAMIDLDEDKFDKVFSTNVLRMGFQKTITDIVYPFLEKVGLMWGIDEINPAQEHFISNLIRQKVITAIDGLTVPNKNSQTFLLFLPEMELHEMGLLLSHYLLKANGKHITYLGQNVPFNDLAEVVEICQPEYLLTFMVTSKTQEEIQDYINKLSEVFADKTILVSGSEYTLSAIHFPKNTQWLKSVADLEKYY